jgi:hypothetical protein
LKEEGEWLMVTFIGLLMTLVIFPGEVSGVEIYSVQVGIYQKVRNAESQCQALRRKFEPAHLEALRIEQQGPRYAVRIGQFNQEKPARHLLSRINRDFPQAFLWKGEYNRAPWVRLCGPAPQRQNNERPSTSGPSRPDFTPASPLETRRAILWGTVLESSPLTGNPLGLVPEREITRVMVRVDQSEAVKGYPNFLQDKETEEIILYAETRQPAFLPAQKIRALVEYQGDKYKRFFWIKQAEPIKP